MQSILQINAKNLCEISRRRGTNLIQTKEIEIRGNCMQRICKIRSSLSHQLPDKHLPSASNTLLGLSGTCINTIHVKTGEKNRYWASWIVGLTATSVSFAI